MVNAQFPDARILIAEDDRANILLLEKILRQAGYGNLISVTDPRELFPAFEQSAPDLILLDLMMPHMSGFEVMERLKSMIPAATFLPILVLTADSTPAAKQKALSGLATDFLTKPFDRIEVLLRIKNLLWMRHLHREQARYEEELENTVRERTMELRATLSDLQRTQQQVIQQERMRALGDMAGGIAHDLNNALSVILGFGELVLQDCARRPELARDIDAMKAIVTAAEDAARMVTRLREFNRPPADEVRQPIDLRALIRQAISLAEPRSKALARSKGISIAVKMGAGKVPPVMGNAAELREALTNLIFNAVDAMPEGGVIKLRASAENEHVLLEVSDTGTGMSEEVRRRCLEPFFSTKCGNGAGLGLAAVYGIVERHGGSLEVESQSGKGTTFRLRFPAAPAPARSGTARRAVPEEPARILIVDRQDIFRDILRAFLEEDCHRVETAASGSEGLQKSAAENFDLIITNQTLCDMPGGELVAELKRRAPAQRVIMLTGFGAAGGAGDTSGADLILGKPISHEALRNAIAASMARPD